jgi:Mg2+ and Co2+ transporter CorA
MNDTPAALLGWAIGIGASAIAAMVALFTLVWNMRRQRAEDINAIVNQVRALELEVARNYVTRAEIREELQGVADRLETAVRNVESKLEELSRFIRERGR